ncbi:MAG: biotin--[acetyl-CoA-carboxylase] ligase [Bacillota bacterium]|nr:biotin--[acetyl-CoA-carboxylase] ligase [Bacillota bacterium]
MGRTWTYFYFDSVESTNDEARRASLEGCPSNSVFCALEQTRGRGRQLRSWSSPRGGLWMSLLVRPELKRDEWPLLTLATAVGIARALRSLGLWAEIKWPNDVLVRGKKICGILCESGEDVSGPSFAVIGVGLNVNLTADQFAPEVREQATSMLVEAGETWSLPQVAGQMVEAIGLQMDRMDAGAKHDVLDEWREMSAVLGKEVVVHGPAETLRGLATDIAQDGALLVQTTSGTVRVYAGDVSLRLAQA